MLNRRLRSIIGGKLIFEVNFPRWKCCERKCKRRENSLTARVCVGKKCNFMFIWKAESVAFPMKNSWTGKKAWSVPKPLRSLREFFRKHFRITLNRTWFSRRVIISKFNLNFKPLSVERHPQSYEFRCLACEFSGGRKFFIWFYSRPSRCFTDKVKVCLE